MSPSILQEVVAKLLEKDVDAELVEELVFIFGQIGLYIPGAYQTGRLDKIDPYDNMFLAAALESHADYIVSYDDKSLLPMKHFHGTQISSPELLMRQLMGLRPEESSEEHTSADLKTEVKALEAGIMTELSEFRPQSLILRDYDFPVEGDSNFFTTIATHLLS